MAPRSNKAKKAADTKIESNGMSKKVKTNNIDKLDQESTELGPEVKEMPVEKKKRGRKPANDAKEGTPLNQHEEGRADNTKIESNEVSKKVKTNVEKVDQENTELEPEETEIPVVEKKKRGRKLANDAKEPSPEQEYTEVEQEKKEIPVVEKKKRGRKLNDPKDPTQEQENTEIEKEIPVEKKKRGRKPVNDAKEQTLPNGEEVPPAKKGRKKKVEATDEIEDKPKNAKGKKAQPKDNATTVIDESSDVDDKSTTNNEDELTSKKQKTDKNEEGKGEPVEDVVAEQEVTEAKPVKGRRRRNVAEPTTQETKDTGEPNKRRRKGDEDKATAEDVKTKAPLKNKATTNYKEIDFSNSSKNSQGKEWNLKISSWNVDGIRAWLSKGGLEYIKHEKPNILCLQEVKCSNDKLPEEVANLPGYHAYWSCSEQDGYAGVGIYTTKLAMNVQYGLNDKELDNEGRIITAEYEQFYLICTYVPNAGRKLVTLPKRLQWNEAFRKYVKELDKKKPVIICGDMNVAHNEIDLSNPKTNRKNAGFTKEERAGMSELLEEGFVDTFRHLNPDKKQAYTFWTYMMNCRAKNVGWRLDYFIVSERLLSSLCDSLIRDQVYGSDHCPITLFLHLTSADKPKE